TPAQVAGTWHVRITNDSPLFDPIKPPVLRDASLIFTSGLKPGVDKIVTTTFVNGTLTTDTPVEAAKVPYPLITAAQFDRGVGPGATIAADNTLSPLLDHQGRIYVAYTDFARNGFNILAIQPDNTDIFLRFSDDGGQTWSSPTMVNDDVNSNLDGY